MTKLDLLKRIDSSIDIGFCQISQVVTAYVGIDEIAIPINWKGTFWDVIEWFETDPKRVPGGYVCDLCPEDRRSVFARREDLWRVEVFEPFLGWVNEKLAHADTVAVSGDPGGTTWAGLVKRA